VVVVAAAVVVVVLAAASRRMGVVLRTGRLDAARTERHLVLGKKML